MVLRDFFVLSYIVCPHFPYKSSDPTSMAFDLW